MKNRKKRVPKRRNLKMLMQRRKLDVLIAKKEDVSLNDVLPTWGERTAKNKKKEKPCEYVDTLSRKSVVVENDLPGKCCNGNSVQRSSTRA